VIPKVGDAVRLTARGREHFRYALSKPGNKLAKGGVLVHVGVGQGRNAGRLFFDVRLYGNKTVYRYATCLWERDDPR